MAQTYAQFKTFLTDMLWRANDVDLANNIDNLIRMADHELNKKLDIQRREVSLAIAPETTEHALPADFYQMISLTSLSPPAVMRSTTKTTLEYMKAADGGSNLLPYYYVQRASTTNTLFLIGAFSATNPGSMSLSYRTAVPDYATDDSSWLEDEFLDLYTYSVFKHVAIFLREDERIATYAGLMEDALASALDEDKRKVQFGGSPLHMEPHHPVPYTRRKS
tara:strand:+ start:78 stop:740 length:663 start_codon:yes stop_codon:yes gene_type:complete